MILSDTVNVEFLSGSRVCRLTIDWLTASSQIFRLLILCRSKLHSSQLHVLLKLTIHPVLTMSVPVAFSDIGKPANDVCSALPVTLWIVRLADIDVRRS